MSRAYGAEASIPARKGGEVQFVFVVPINHALERFKPQTPEPQPTRKCPECLSDIPLAARRCAFCTAVVEPQASA